MSYKPSSQVTWELSPIYNALKYRSPETITKEEVLDEFVEWLEYDSELSSKQAESAVKFLLPLFAEFVGYDQDKAQAGEREMLANWIKSNG